ncbi:MAG TPA: cohesin domain-containing protein, partial [Saprospiraceae bacterium]|nr:cohesin domain-containing protein [Saprospiraceae bacterium]
MRNILLILIFFASLMGSGRSSAQVVLKTDTITVPCSSTDTFLVPLRVLNFTDVGSFQFTLSWNSQNLDYIATGPLQTEFTSGPVNFGFDTSAVFVNSGKLTFNWTRFGGATVPDSTIIFQIAFVRIGGPYTTVGFSNDPVIVEVTDPDGNEVPWMVMNGGVKPVDTEGPSITCPANVTVPGAGPTPVPGIAPASLTDNCGVPAAGFAVTGATTFNAPNDPDASGTSFNLGQSTVTYTATDVGGQTASCSFTVTVEPALTDDFTLIAGNVNGSCNTTLVVPITTLNFDSLGSLQFSLGWNPQVLGYQSVGNFNPSLMLAPSNFGVAQVNSGFLSFNWTTGQPLTGGTSLPDGAVLFTIQFTVAGTAGTNSSIAFGDFPSVKEAYQVSDLINELPIVTINGQSNISDNVAPVLTCP